ncbi:hypothetical protein R1flu_018267 [Riccia fluitans]|uniref:Uncharacterized protein n=1 Tax=Riccia fluitans TaxID=41844 RepID=A0ABD1ZIS7_9MARC
MTRIKAESRRRIHKKQSQLWNHNTLLLLKAILAAAVEVLPLRIFPIPSRGRTCGVQRRECATVFRPSGFDKRRPYRRGSNIHQLPRSWVLTPSCWWRQPRSLHSHPRRGEPAVAEFCEQSARGSSMALQTSNHSDNVTAAQLQVFLMGSELESDWNCHG